LVIQTSNPKAERKIIAILKILSSRLSRLGSITIARKLQEEGIFLSERAVRYHLKIADERGYTEPLGRGGRRLTSQGMEELRVALPPTTLALYKRSWSYWLSAHFRPG